MGLADRDFEKDEADGAIDALTILETPRNASSKPASLRRRKPEANNPSPQGEQEFRAHSRPTLCWARSLVRRILEHISANWPF